MHFKCHDIGKYQFVQFEDYIFEQVRKQKQDVTQNLKWNYKMFGRENFIEVTNAKMRMDWNGYRFDGQFLNGEYLVTLPIRKRNMEFQKIHAHHWKTVEGDKYYTFTEDDRPLGTILIYEGENVKNTLEECIGDICYKNAYMAEPFQNESRLFPFSSKEIREKYHFIPALIEIKYPV